jgi:hypothetical protein
MWPSETARFGRKPWMNSLRPHMRATRDTSLSVLRLQNVYGRGARSQIEPPGFFRNKGLVS